MPQTVGAVAMRGGVERFRVAPRIQDLQPDQVSVQGVPSRRAGGRPVERLGLLRFHSPPSMPERPPGRINRGPDAVLIVDASCRGGERYMEIAIIGAGNVGKALAKSAVRAGHKVTLSAANPEHAEEAARATGAKSARSNVEAVKDAEIVIVAVPYDK